MKRIACMMGVVAVVIAAALVTSQAGAGAGAAAEPTSIKDVMDALHKGAKSPLAQLKTQLKAETPNWAEIQGETKEFVTIGASLAKFEPPKGDAADYKSQATTYYSNAKALDEAAQKKDLAATKKAFGKISASCKDCHTAHKGG
jgi:cytochrome c556